MNSFFGTNLDEHLKAKGLKKIVLVGFQAQFCITNTAVYGIHLGYRVFVVQDAIGSHNLLSWDNKRKLSGEELVEAACNFLGDAITVVIKSDEIED
ncbi:hypothetical protein JCM10908_005949 [Rhodotorula pacifica]|uniref:uncharacterized protein n=1 Tax=Rhodotorula pacifica TaxID=1495444 RepID=UPI0031802790